MNSVGSRRMLAAFALFALALVAIVLLGRPVGAGAAGAAGELTVQPSLGAPAAEFLGASPQEAAGEAWAITKNRHGLARYTSGGGWELAPAPVAAGGGPIQEIRLAEGASAGRTTANGAIAVGAENASQKVVLVRDPGGIVREAPEPVGLLEPGEELFAEAPMLAVADAVGHARAFVVPAGRKSILDFNGEEWSREEICAKGVPPPGCTLPPATFRVLAIEAAAGEAWLLGKNAVSGEGIELFRREASGGPGGTPVWRQQALGGALGALYEQEKPLGTTLVARTNGQPLTVSDTGVWADAVLASGGESTEATIYYDIASGQVTGSWCDLPNAELCTHTLGAELPGGQARSFAWSGGGSFGQRVITGIGQGAILSLSGTEFARIPLGGGDAGASLGAALSAPDQGWLGAEPPLQLTYNPEPTNLEAWPVPFRRPLLAIAPEPGAPVGALGSEALAVGDNGQVARYVPGQGWEPEALLRSSGKRATPTLRGVAWPVSSRAYAVGDNAAMWLWQKSTGLWGPDPAAPPNLARANFTAIAFDPQRPNRGYAVGKQGLLLSFGREWTKEPLPAGVPAEANFTSISFAGNEAIATYKVAVDRGSLAVYGGGVIVNDGSGWRVDDNAQAALGVAVPQRVAGLPDGGAVIASIGSGEAGVGGQRVIVRQGVGAAWQAAPSGAIGYPAALAAIREGDQVRAIVSVAEGQGNEDIATDQEQVFNQPSVGQPPLLTDAYPLPKAGVVARQTATGWRDEEHQQFPLPSSVEGQQAYDLAQQADPVLALLVSPDGSQGWAVGGETGTGIQFQGDALQTASVSRYGVGAALPPNAATAPVLAEAGTASFAIGGDAQCAAACADLAGAGIGPDRWLKSAVGKAAGIGGVRAFLFTGPGVAGSGPSRLGATLSPAGFAREESAYARRLGSSAGALPVFAAPAESDLDRSNSLSTFATAFSGFGAPFGSAPPGGGITPISQATAGQPYYSFYSGSGKSTVQVIVLDYSATTLGDGQRCWLAGQIASAGAANVPAVVVGKRDLGRQAPDRAADAGQVVPVLLGAALPGCSPGGAAASAYFFDFPEENRTYSLNSGGRTIPAFGSGTLGYVQPPLPVETDFAGASGFLLASVRFSERDPATNIAPVSARLIPNVGSLALDPTDGTLIRRSRQALFQALARRPLAGLKCTGNAAPKACETKSPEPYVPIPTQCVGSKCATAVFPDYTFTSSEPDIADFVAPDPRSPNPRNVLLVHNKPVLDSHSGLLCAFNEGTTAVTVSTGGLTYSQKVTVLGGTAQRPCGTTPLRKRPKPDTASPTVPPPAGQPPPGGTPPSFPPPPPPALAPAPVPAPVAHHPAPPPPLPPVFFSTPAQLTTPLVPIVPPPPPLLLQPTPPSGSSYVQEKEEEEEEAVEHSSLAVAERLSGRPAGAPALVPSGGGNSGFPIYILPALVLVAALAGVSLRPRRPRRDRPEISYAHTNSSPRRRR